jgi:hypothetical protein
VRFVRENSLSLCFGLMFVAALAGQAFAGLADYNNQQIADGLSRVSLGDYVTSSSFAVDVVENWQSEYLQFLLYIVLTVWLVQRGSPESKELGKHGGESDEEQRVGRYAREDSPRWAAPGGLRTAVFSNSLGLVMGAIFLASWFAQAVAGWAAYNEERLRQLQDPLSWSGYLSSADFWTRSLQNWQSEFLAIGSMAVLSIFLRQRGSPESKPVGVSHQSTGVSG